MPTLRRAIARRLAFDADRSAAMAAALVSLIDAATGVTAAWEGRRRLVLPKPLLAAIKGNASLARVAGPRAKERPVVSADVQASAAEVTRLQAAGPSTPEARRAGIAAWREKLTPDELSRADVKAGRGIWKQRCATCHMLFGEGGNVGPDLTGSGRADPDYVILNVMDPSAVVPEAWRLTQVITADGRVVAGAVAASDDRTLTPRTPPGDMVLDREEIDEVITRKQSVMPEGLWNGLSDEDVRDVVAYLAVPVQVE